MHVLEESSLHAEKFHMQEDLVYDIRWFIISYGHAWYVEAIAPCSTRCRGRWLGCLPGELSGSGWVWHQNTPEWHPGKANNFSSAMSKLKIRKHYLTLYMSERPHKQLYVYITLKLWYIWRSGVNAGISLQCTFEINNMKLMLNFGISWTPFFTSWTKHPARLYIQSKLDTTQLVGSKPSNQVVTEARIILYYHPSTFSFTQSEKTWDTFK